MEPTAKDALMGYWRIVWLDSPTTERLGDEPTGHFDFTEVAQGDFRFGDMVGIMKCTWSRTLKPPRLDFVWQESNTALAASGSGWAVVRGAKMAGAVIWQNGKRSRFLALRETDDDRFFA